MRTNLLTLALLAMLGAGLAVPTAARADSRIFSVSTDTPGVTVTQAVRDGRALPVVGKSGGATFFRIDVPNAVVPCSNHLVMTASDGRQADETADLCASNWELAVSFAPAAAPPQGDQTVTISTDDPSATIDGIFLDRKAVAIDSRLGNAVRITVPADPEGIQCKRDLGLALADGRRIARQVDLCADNWSVVVSLTGDIPAPPPAPDTTAIPAPPDQSGNQQGADGSMVWTYTDGSDQVSLVYGIPQTDASEFTATCSQGSGRATISLSRSADGVRPRATVFVAFSVGAFAKSYSGVGTPVSDVDGTSHPEISVSIDDGLWPALIREQTATLRIASGAPFDLSLRGSSGPVRQFVEACGTALTAGTPPPPAEFPGAPPPPDGNGPSCRDEGRVHSVEGVTESTIIFRNYLNQPVQIFWLDYQGRREPILTLGPGDKARQQTFVTHLWLAADMSGRCIGIYLAPVGQGVASIGRR